jgi:glycosyltransferase domain-containing protein
MKVIDQLNQSSFQFMQQTNYDLSTLTVILTTYERPKLLLRQLLYMQHWNVIIEIVDGSKQPLPPYYKSFIQKLPNVNYRHDRSSVNRRIAEAATRVKTPYVIVLADDDIYLQSGLYKAIRKLDLDLSAGACLGGVCGYSKLYNHYYIFKYGENLSQYIINSKKPSERIVQGFRQWRSGAWYALYRAEHFKKIWEKCEIEPGFRAIEEVQSVKAFYHVEFANIGDLYWLRGFANESIDLSNNILLSENRTFSDWCTAQLSKSHKISFVEINKSMFGKKIDISETEAKHVFQVVTELPNKLDQISLVDLNGRARLLEKVAFNVKKFRLLKLTIRSNFWQEKITPFVLYLKRHKIRESNKNKKIEIKRVLNYCKNFDHIYSNVQIN